MAWQLSSNLDKLNYHQFSHRYSTEAHLLTHRRSFARHGNRLAKHLPTLRLNVQSTDNEWRKRNLVLAMTFEGLLGTLSEVNGWRALGLGCWARCSVPHYVRASGLFTRLGATESVVLLLPEAGN